MKFFQRLAIGIFLSGTITIGAQAQTINTDEETTQPKQGLYLVEGTKVDIAYVHPDLNLTKYDRILVRPLAYSLEQSDKEAEKKRRRECSKSIDKLRVCTGENPFALNDNDKNEMAKMFAEIMAKHMEKGPPIEMVSEPSAGVLVFQPTIVKITLTAPKESSRFSSGRSARSGVYTRSSGSITLVGQFFDGGTGELIAHIVDQQIGTDFWHKNTRISNWGDIEMAFHFWSRLFRTRLDQDFATEIE